MSETRSVHWADAIAQELLQTQTQPLLSTGITPSGEYHVGHLREVLTADGVYRALQSGRGVPDQLRRRYHGPPAPGL